MNKIRRIEYLLKEEDFPDIVAIVETWMNEDILDAEVQIPNYKIVARKDRIDTAGGRGGGILIYAKTNLKCFTKETSQICESTQIVRVRVNDYLLTAVYKSPSQSKCDNLKLFDFLKNVPSNSVIIGDFNFPKIDWRTMTPTGAKVEMELFLDSIQESFLNQLVRSSTHRAGNILDLVLVNNENTIHDMQILEEQAISDHFPMIIELNLTTERPDTTEFIPDYRRANFQGLRQYLFDSNLPLRMTGMKTEEMWNYLKNELNNAVHLFVPLKKRRESNHQVWKNKNVRHHINQRKRLWKQYKVQKTMESKKEFRAVASLTKEVIKEAQKEFEDKLAEGLDRDPKLLYTYMKSKTKSHDTIGPLVDENGALECDPKKQANILNRYFSSVFGTDLQDAVVRDVTEEDGLQLVYFDPEAIKKNVLKLKNKSSPGPDKITPRLLKECIELLKLPLSILFNMSIQEGVVPEDWRMANVTPIFKKGQKCQPSNYRPISLTSHVGKLMERTIAEKVKKHLHEHNLLNEAQHGFRESRSTTTNLLSFWNTVTENLDRNEPVDVLYLDFAKAFDRVSHSLLVSKLKNFKIGGKLANWIKNWLSDRKQKVVINGEESDTTKVTSSVPQGSVLGPVLFSIFINDLPENVECETYMFADDTKCLRKVTSLNDCLKFQEEINRLYEWSEKWQMQFNADKCKILHFGHNNKKFNYEMNGTIIQSSDQEKDLGILVSRDGKFNSHVDMVASKANRCAGMIRRNFVTRNPRTMEKLFRTYINPILNYGSEVWNPSYKGQIEKLEKVQRRFYRGTNVQVVSQHVTRMRKDILTMHRIKSGRLNLRFTDFFKMLESNTRGAQNMNIVVQKARKDPRRHSFSIRQINQWNRIPKVYKEMNSIKFQKELKSLIK